MEEFIPINAKCVSDKDSSETFKTAGSFNNNVVCLGEKQISVEEFIPIYAKCKSDKDSGVYEDFIECLKLYDKQENGLIQLTELTHALLSLGTKLVCRPTTSRSDELLFLVISTIIKYA